MLEDEEFQTADIFMLLPDDPTRSDEDSGPEDDDGVVDNLTGNQLRVNAESMVTVSVLERKLVGMPSDDETESDTESEVVPASTKRSRVASSAVTVNDTNSDTVSVTLPPVVKISSASKSQNKPSGRLRNINTTQQLTPPIRRQGKESLPSRQWVKRT